MCRSAQIMLFIYLTIHLLNRSTLGMHSAPGTQVQTQKEAFHKVSREAHLSECGKCHTRYVTRFRESTEGINTTWVEGERTEENHLLRWR